jgi:inhibitor of KinA sporulation pathway (predicted exonuclease)
MARDLSVILVVDVESTCWSAEGGGAADEAPPGQQSEIIEIGVAVVDTGSLRIQQCDDLLVKPAHSEVSAFCTQLTTLTPAQVNGGVPFVEACRVLKKRYAAQECSWASWGDYDRSQFERQCRVQTVAYPFGKTHLNVKNLFSLVHALPEELGMAEALAHAGLTLEGTHHRAHHDAKNIARLLIGLLGTLRRAGKRA